MDSKTTLSFHQIITTAAAMHVMSYDVPSAFTRKDWLKGKDLTPANYPTGSGGGYLRPVTIWLRNCRTFIRDVKAKYPQAFRGPAPGTVGRDYLGINTEDMSRFFFLNGHLRGRERDLRKQGDVNFVKEKCGPADRTRLHTFAATPPLFKTHTGARIPTKRETADEEAMLRSMEMKHKIDHDINFNMKADAEGPSKADDNMEILHKLLSTSQVNGGKQAKKGKKGERGLQAPAISPDQYDRAIDCLTRSLVTLYDRPDEEARKQSVNLMQDPAALELARFATAMADYQVAHVEAAAKDPSKQSFTDALKERMDADREFAQRIFADSSSLDQTPAGMAKVVRIASDLAVQKAFRAFQGNINSLSAVPPTFEEALAWTGFTALTDAAEAASGLAKGRGDAPLYPHQVQGVAWNGQMLRSELHAAVLSDETGLGKTIQSMETDEAVTGKIKEDLEEAGGKPSHRSHFRVPATNDAISRPGNCCMFSRPRNCSLIFPAEKSVCFPI